MARLTERQVGRGRKVVLELERRVHGERAEHARHCAKLHSWAAAHEQGHGTRPERCHTATASRPSRTPRHAQSFLAADHAEASPFPHTRNHIQEHRGGVRVLAQPALHAYWPGAREVADAALPCLAHSGWQGWIARVYHGRRCLGSGWGGVSCYLVGEYGPPRGQSMSCIHCRILELHDVVRVGLELPQTTLKADRAI